MSRTVSGLTFTPGLWWSAHLLLVLCPTSLTENAVLSVIRLGDEIRSKPTTTKKEFVKTKSSLNDLNLDETHMDLKCTQLVCTRWLCRMQPRPHYFRLNDPHNDFTAHTHLRRHEDQMSGGDVQSPRAGVSGVYIIQQLDIFHLRM